MELKDIEKHWQNWAMEFGSSLRATTKSSTAKIIEIDALKRTIQSIVIEKGDKLKILEVGCGNGKNCLELVKCFPKSTFKGVDFIEEMIVSAIKSRNELGINKEKLDFSVANVLELNLPAESFDIIFTNRCLINLNTDDLQHVAIERLCSLLKPEMYLLMLENSKQTYDTQNKARQSVGLEARRLAEFNHFMDETLLFPFLRRIGLPCLDVEDFISLHDVILYILLPMVNGGKIDYDSPLVSAAAKLNMALSAVSPSCFGEFGQNRMYICKKNKR